MKNLPFGKGCGQQKRQIMGWGKMLASFAMNGGLKSRIYGGPKKVSSMETTQLKTVFGG